MAKIGSPAPRRLIGAALLGALATLAAAPPAEAKRSREETETFLRRVLTERCQLEQSGSVDGDCQVYFRGDVLVIERQVNRVGRLAAGRDLGDTLLRQETRFAFAERSFFFCGETNAETGLMTLFMSCDFDQGALAEPCVTHMRSTERQGATPDVEWDETPIARIARVEPKRCVEASRALNSLIDPNRAGADPFARNPD